MDGDNAGRAALNPAAAARVPRRRYLAMENLAQINISTVFYLLMTSGYVFFLIRVNKLLSLG